VQDKSLIILFLTNVYPFSASTLPLVNIGSTDIMVAVDRTGIKVTNQANEGKVENLPWRD